MNQTAAKRLILYHAQCNDGFGAAWVAWSVYGKKAQYIAIQHGDTPPEVDQCDVLVLDFSFPREILLNLANRARSLYVLDHHATAQKDLEGLDFAQFDLDRSGATMTWQHFFPDEPCPWLLEYIEDRDLWRWQLDESEEVAAALQSHKRTFKTWSTLIENGRDALVAEGRPIVRYKKRLIDAAASRNRIVDFMGYRVPMVNSCVLQSEIGGRLAKKHPFVVIVFEIENRRVYSLRSHGKNGIDVGELAGKFGGGGHHNAAGFTVRLDDNGTPIGKTP